MKTDAIISADSFSIAESSVLKKILSQRIGQPAATDVLTASPKFSIVIPSLNQAEYLERTLLSVLNQNYSNLELIVIDGGSTDGALEIIEKYRDDITYFYSGPDNGQSDALNHGFSKATGDIFAWLNSDDVYLPGAMGVAKKAFDRFPTATVIFGDWWSIDSEDNVTEVNYAFDFNLRHFKPNKLILKPRAALLDKGQFPLAFARNKFSLRYFFNLLKLFIITSALAPTFS